MGPRETECAGEMPLGTELAKRREPTGKLRTGIASSDGAAGPA